MSALEGCGQPIEGSDELISTGQGDVDRSPDPVVDLIADGQLDLGPIAHGPASARPPATRPGSEPEQPGQNEGPEDEGKTPRELPAINSVDPQPGNAGGKGQEPNLGRSCPCVLVGIRSMN